MPMMIDTVEGRLQMELGQRDFRIAVLEQQLDEAQRKITDLQAEVERLKEGQD